MLTRRAVLRAVPAAALPLALQRSWAEAYPSKPILLIVPSSAGGASDNCARAAADRMRQSLAQPFVVENRPGATGDIGLRTVAGAAPDGYTLAQVSAANTANMTARPNKAFSLTERMRPVGKIGVSAFTLTVPKSLGVKSVEDFIAYAKARPGKLTYASIGPGSSQHLVAEMFCAAAGLDLGHVPYRGEIAAAPDLIEGRVQLMFMAGAKPLLATGEMIGLGTTNRTQWPALPELRPLGEIHALKGFFYNGWNGLMAPAQTPDAVVRKLSTALVAALKDEGMVNTLRTLGFEPGKGTPEDLAEQIRWDVQNFKRIITERRLTFPE